MPFLTSESEHECSKPLSWRSKDWSTRERNFLPQDVGTGKERCGDRAPDPERPFRAVQQEGGAARRQRGAAEEEDDRARRHHRHLKQRQGTDSFVMNFVGLDPLI